MHCRNAMALTVVQPQPPAVTLPPPPRGPRGNGVRTVNKKKMRRKGREKETNREKCAAAFLKIGSHPFAGCVGLVRWLVNIRSFKKRRSSNNEKERKREGREERKYKQREMW